VGYRLDYAGLSFVHSGDTRPGWPLVRACEGGVDLLIHECFPPPAAMAAAWGISVERATVIVNAAHTTPATAGKVFDLVHPRIAGLRHTIVASPIVPQVFAELRKVYDGPVVQTQDVTVFNITEQAVVTRQSRVSPQTMPGPRTAQSRGHAADADTQIGGPTHSSQSTTSSPGHEPACITVGVERRSDAVWRRSVGSD
jgi:ribonuclease Z